MPQSRPATPPEIEAELHTISGYELARLDFQRFTNDLHKRVQAETADTHTHEELADVEVELAGD